MTLKRGSFFSALVLVLGLIFVCSGGADAKLIYTVLEVTGLLEEINETAVPPEITLKVDGEPASGPLNESCAFMNERGMLLSQRDFVRGYVGKVVTLEIFEHNGEVISCRAGL